MSYTYYALKLDGSTIIRYEDYEAALNGAIYYAELCESEIEIVKQVIDKTEVFLTRVRPKENNNL